MDWLRGLSSPLMRDWNKDMEALSLIELDYKGNVCRSTITNVFAYECVNCSQPVFTRFYGKEMSVGEFAARSSGVFISIESVSFNGGVFDVINCHCEAELGYFIMELRRAYPIGTPDTFWVRRERVRSQDSSREVKLMEFVNNKARSVLSQLQKKLPSGELKCFLTPEFMAAVGSAAVDVANRVISGSGANDDDVQAPLVPPFYQFFPEKPNESNCRELMESEKKPKRAKGYEDDECCLSPLMEDMLFEEILPRLPAESLIKFKQVSKKWLHHITTDSCFIYNHLRRQSQATKLSVIHSMDMSPGIGRLLFVDSHDNTEARVREVSTYTERFNGAFLLPRVVGSCNGLVCLRVLHLQLSLDPLVGYRNQSEPLVLWNPQTGEGREIPVPALTPEFDWSLGGQVFRSAADHSVFGIGFDADRNDYKVVRVVPTEPTRLNFDVFSRNSGEWRRIEKGLFGHTVCTESSDSVLLHDRLYWLVLAVESNNAKRRCILSFDLRDDEFRIIDVLGDRTYLEVHPFRGHKHRLVKWGHNFLAFISFIDSQSKHLRLELVLDSCGNAVVGQTQDTLLLSPGFFKSGWTFCGASRDRLFVAEHGLDYTSKLIMYGPFIGHRDDENDGLKQVSSDWRWGLDCRVLDYVPSLVSVYPDRKRMREEEKKMEAKYWVDMLWQMVRVNKQFGLCHH